ncbi:MAG: hypothetical protein KBS65_07480 [Prevotella sp.]|nr:hypothetical protein [Candidatus Equicola stercoris]
MKRFLFLSLCLMLHIASVMAQDFHEISVRYSPMMLSMEWQGPMEGYGTKTERYNGFAVGYKRGFELWEETNLYAVAGATIQWNSKKYDHIDIPDESGEGNQSIVIDDRENFLNVVIPLSIMYHFCITENVGLEPYAGIQGTWHAIAEDSYSNQYQDDYGKPNKFAFGCHAGLDITYNRFAIGGGYQMDFTKFDDNIVYYSKCSRWNIKLAFRF